MRLAPLIALAACTGGTPSTPSPSPTGRPLGSVDVPVSPPPVTHTLSVAADGSVTPATLAVRPGDTVVWAFDAPGAVVPVDADAPDPCAAVAPYAAGDLTGPLGASPGGVFALGPWEAGFEVVPAEACDACASAPDDGGRCLCPTGERGAALEETWAHPGIAGVFVRLEWDDVEPAPGVFDWSALDREADAAVAHGKWFSVAIKAGDHGTPGWLPEVGAPLVAFRDHGVNQEGCGEVVHLGLPTDPVYEERWLAVLSALGDHLRSRADWWRALASVKVSGANFESAENHLPKSCDPGCTCNPEIWAAEGYTPSGLYDFYEAQLDVLDAHFPGKATSFALIPDGFPQVGESGSYLGQSPAPTDLPAPAEQTDEVLARGRARGPRFVIQENSLSVLGDPANGRAVAAGKDGAIIGFQTTNDHTARPVATPADLDSTLLNAWRTTDAVFVEAYEERLWEWGTGPGPSGRTLADWTARFAERRVTEHPEWAQETDTHTWVVDAAPGTTLGFADPARCATAGWGVLEVR
jgi:hypothetical protein